MEKDSDKRQEAYLSVYPGLHDFFHQYFVIFSTQTLYMFCSIMPKNFIVFGVITIGIVFLFQFPHVCCWYIEILLIIVCWSCILRSC